MDYNHFSILFFPVSIYTDNLPFNLEIAHMCRHTAKFVYNFACVFDCVFVSIDALRPIQHIFQSYRNEFLSDSSWVESVLSRGLSGVSVLYCRIHTHARARTHARTSVRHSARKSDTQSQVKVCTISKLQVHVGLNYG